MTDATTAAVVVRTVEAMARSMLPLLQIAVAEDMRRLATANASLERRIAVLERQQTTRPSGTRRHNEASER
jgi:hypothetical protein